MPENDEFSGIFMGVFYQAQSGGECPHVFRNRALVGKVCLYEAL